MNSSQFYTNIARVIAGIVIVMGISGIAMGLSIATGFFVEPEPGRYIGTHTTGEVIDKGTYYIIFGVTLGMFTEVSRSLFNKDNGKAKDT